jgi:hypothetical protein
MSINDARKAKRGRPVVNSTPITLRLVPDQLAKLDAWIAAQPDPVSRPEAVRIMIAIVLDA